ncbi:hypothetical protein [Microbulbifer sp. S227A]|uniref:hypothetical protein n=1 Tax=Microbulbifer sp. S227A TaxID=3415131 RepID=UPI003C7BA4B8
MGPDDAQLLAFERNGWLVFAPDPSLLHWGVHARPAARAAVADPAHARWLDCDGTWFVGVDVLPNDPRGRVAGSPPLAGAAVRFIERCYGALPPLHPAQVSVTYPGYPRPRRGESEPAARYRQVRDAAHVDGLRAIGEPRRRYLCEPHGFILGLPLSRAAPKASPLVVWEGSHHIMRAAFTGVFADQTPEACADIDVTDIYVAARKRVFERCRRVALPVQPGEAVLLHRMALHGVAPWDDGARADPEGRMIAYFRPEMPGGIAQWLGAQP